MFLRTGPLAAERKELNKPYLARELTGANEAVKAPQRERVLDFFSRRMPAAGKPYRLFCLPGANWAFENEFRHRFGRHGDFIGVERTWDVLRHGIKSMPGYELTHEDFYIVDKRYQGYTTDAARTLWCKASEFMGLVGREVKNMDSGNRTVGKRASRTLFVERWKKWTHVWLDFCSPINDEVVLCVKRLENFLAFDQPVVPVAVTFMVGREDRMVSTLIRAFAGEDESLPKAADRARFLQVLWDGNQHREAEPVECWQYLSAGGAAMGVATFLLRTVENG